jgi:hypothetical protein
LASSWNHFTTLLASGPDLSLKDPILLQHFYKGLHKNSKQLLDTTSRGSFLHVSSEKTRLILDPILSSKLDNLLEELQVDEANSLPDIPSTSAIPKSEQEEEEILFSDLMLDIEPDIFFDFGNFMNYHSIKKPQNHHNHLRESLNLSEDVSYRSTSVELVSIISSEWLEESELSSHVIRLDSPSLPIRCSFNSNHIDALYNPVVGINIMSVSLAQHLMRHMTLTPTTKLIKSLSGYIVPSLGILHIQPIQVKGTLVHLSFYVFPIWDFDLLIGQHFRRLLYEGQIGKINIYFGKKL